MIWRTARGRRSGDPVADASSLDDRRVPAPQLRETAAIRFDVECDPVVEWDAAGRRFELVDPDHSATHRLVLFEATCATSQTERIAQALADGLAACDFPPTQSGAAPTHVSGALRAAGIDPDTL